MAFSTSEKLLIFVAGSGCVDGCLVWERIPIAMEELAGVPEKALVTNQPEVH